MTLPAKVHREIVRRVLEGEKPDAVAADLGITLYPVYAAVRRAGAKLPHGGFRHARRAELDDTVRAAAEAAWPETPTQLAARLKLTRWAVYKSAKRQGLKILTKAVSRLTRGV